MKQTKGTIQINGTPFQSNAALYLRRENNIQPAISETRSANG